LRIINRQMSKDYYKTLGVDKGASQDEIKKSFRKLAHEHHPDKQGGNADKFKEASEAYGVLGDAEKRKQYDQFGSAAFNGGAGGFGGQNGGGFSGFEGFDFSGFGGGFNQGSNGQGFEFDLGDIFGSMFSGGRGGRGGSGRGDRGSHEQRGADIQVDVNLSFKESIFGLEKEINITKHAKCSSCKGTRAEPGTNLKTCKNCNGEGHVVKQQRTILGTMENVVVCDQCEGTGKIPETKCKTCKGKGVEMKKDSLRIVIPPGIENGETLRVRGSGEAVATGENGDLYVRIYVKGDPRFRKQGYDLYADLPIGVATAVLGGTAPFESLDEKLVVKIPEGIQHGEILRIKGKGVPHSAAAGAHRGELMLRIIVRIPAKLSKEQRQLFERLRESE
jgi:molecular chaperone DnaJ